MLCPGGEPARSLACDRAQSLGDSVVYPGTLRDLRVVAGPRVGERRALLSVVADGKAAWRFATRIRGGGI